MNAFMDASKLEKKARPDVFAFLVRNCLQGRIVVADHGDLAKVIQKDFGDFFINSRNGEGFTIQAIEAKFEEADYHGNFFLETWSNKNPDVGYFTLGWLFTINADFLFYYFYREKDLYVMRVRDLKKWAFHNPSQKTLYPGRVCDFPEREQKKRGQLNVTCGRCVPIKTLCAEMNIKHYNLAWELSADSLDVLGESAA